MTFDHRICIYCQPKAERFSTWHQKIALIEITRHSCQHMQVSIPMMINSLLCFRFSCHSIEKRAFCCMELRLQSLQGYCFQGGIFLVLVTVFLLVPSCFLFQLVVFRRPASALKRAFLVSTCCFSQTSASTERRSKKYSRLCAPCLISLCGIHW
jgi:hypothetical protein